VFNIRFFFSGMIIGWGFDEISNTWTVEMSNSWNRAPIHDICWAPNGSMFAIIYDVHSNGLLSDFCGNFFIKNALHFRHEII